MKFSKPRKLPILNSISTMWGLWSHMLDKDQPLSQWLSIFLSLSDYPYFWTYFIWDSSTSWYSVTIFFTETPSIPILMLSYCILPLSDFNVKQPYSKKCLYVIISIILSGVRGNEVISRRFSDQPLSILIFSDIFLYRVC